MLTSPETTALTVRAMSHCFVSLFRMHAVTQLRHPFVEVMFTQQISAHLGLIVAPMRMTYTLYNCVGPFLLNGKHFNSFKEIFNLRPGLS